MTGVDIASVVLRAVVGITMFAHGYNHIWGGGRLPGTARWLESIGLRPGRLHALVASVTELGAGLLLIVGAMTPAAAAAVIGTMGVAFVTNHRKNGFFIFRPGEGYEYVVMILCVSAGIAALGGGKLSVDYLLGFADDLAGGWSIVLTVTAGCGGAGLILVTSWRPPRS